MIWRRQCALLGWCGVAAGFATACNPDSRASDDSVPSNPAVASVPTPAEQEAGEILFNASCASCHGQRGSGTNQGPPLVHVIYRPDHHADASFYRAAQFGVRAHHWQFGDMPPVQDVPEADIGKIVAYVRWLQQAAGIN